jgi:hypothetical protein
LNLRQTAKALQNQRATAPYNLRDGAATPSL